MSSNPKVPCITVRGVVTVVIWGFRRQFLMVTPPLHISDASQQ